MVGGDWPAGGRWMGHHETDRQVPRGHHGNDGLGSPW